MLRARSRSLADPERAVACDQPDMLIVGNTPCPGARGNHCHSLTHDQEQTQMAIWAIAAAPLFFSTDLRHVPAASKAILLNKELLQISQDPLARSGHRFYHNVSTGAQGWVRELHGGDVAVALHNGGGNKLHHSHLGEARAAAVLRQPVAPHHAQLGDDRLCPGHGDVRFRRLLECEPGRPHGKLHLEADPAARGAAAARRLLPGLLNNVFVCPPCQ